MPMTITISLPPIKFGVRNQHNGQVVKKLNRRAEICSGVVFVLRLTDSGHSVDGQTSQKIVLLHNEFPLLIQDLPLTDENIHFLA